MDIVVGTAQKPEMKVSVNKMIVGRIHCPEGTQKINNKCKTVHDSKF